MSIHEKLWKKLPEVLCFIVWDDDGFSGFCYRPSFDRDDNRWVSGNSEEFDWLDINGIALPRPFQRLNRLSPEAAIYQRPSSWDGQLRIGDAVRLKNSDQVYIVNGFFNNEKVWLEDSELKQLTLLPWDRIVMVNGMSAKGRLTKKFERQSHPGLPPEVHNNDDVDIERAMDVLRRMCRS